MCFYQLSLLNYRSKNALDEHELLAISLAYKYLLNLMMLDYK